jgi:hypothetical protein
LSTTSKIDLDAYALKKSINTYAPKRLSYTYLAMSATLYQYTGKSPLPPFNIDALDFYDRSSLASSSSPSTFADSPSQLERSTLGDIKKCHYTASARDQTPRGGKHLCRRNYQRAVDYVFSSSTSIFLPDADPASRRRVSLLSRRHRGPRLERCSSLHELGPPSPSL